MDRLAPSEVVATRPARRWLLARATELALLALGTTAVGARTVLRLARLENIPDQFVGGEILKAVYQRLDIAVEFVDLPAKRALIESSQGRVDGEVQRILAVQSEFDSARPMSTKAVAAAHGGHRHRARREKRLARCTSTCASR